MKKRGARGHRPKGHGPKFLVGIAIAFGLLCYGSMVSVTPAQAANLILSEDFEDGVLDSRISIETVGTFNSNPGIKDITNFGSTKAFGYGMSTCGINCFDGYVTNFKITLPQSTYVSTISFKEMELYENWGSRGKIYIDGVPLTWGSYHENEDFGRQPTNDRQPDTTYRSQSYSVNQHVTIIELTVHDITNLSEIFIDDVEIFGVVFTQGIISGYVTDINDNDIARARVKLFHGGKPIGSTKTNAKGYYEFIGLADGKYKLKAKKRGYGGDKKVGKVQQAQPWGKEEFINFILSPQ